MAKTQTKLASAICTFAAGLLLSGTALATFAETPAYSVYQLRSHSTNQGGSLDWFTLNTTSTFGTTCAGWGGRIVFIIQDDEKGKKIYSIIQAALLSGRTISAAINDTKTSGGYCYVQYVTVGP